MTSIFVTGMGFHVPSERISNAQLASQLDTSEGWLDEHLGINSRRRSADNETTARMGALALEVALAESSKQKAEIDLLMCATATPDLLIPATACQIGNLLGINPVSFDIGATCSGFPYALSVAAAMLQTTRFQCAALVASDRFTRFVDYEDRRTCVFFGDSASSVLLESTRPHRGLELVDHLLLNRNEGASTVTMPVHGYFTQDGRKVREEALKGFEEVVTCLLSRNHMTSRDLAGFVGHQANYRILEQVCQTLGVPEAKHWHNVREFGNQGGAGCLTALCQHIQQRKHELRDGDAVVVATFGAGFTMGALLFRWCNSE